jgi:hypothetical protein
MSWIRSPTGPPNSKSTIAADSQRNLVRRTALHSVVDNFFFRADGFEFNPGCRLTSATNGMPNFGVLLSVTNIAQIARGNSGVQSDEDFQSIGKVLFGQLFLEHD